MSQSPPYSYFSKYCRDSNNHDNRYRRKEVMTDDSFAWILMEIDESTNIWCVSREKSFDIYKCVCLFLYVWGTYLPFILQFVCVVRSLQLFHGIPRDRESPSLIMINRYRNKEWERDRVRERQRERERERERDMGQREREREGGRDWERERENGPRTRTARWGAGMYPTHTGIDTHTYRYRNFFSAYTSDICGFIYFHEDSCETVTCHNFLPSISIVMSITITTIFWKI